MIWIRLLYATPRSMVEVNVIRLKPLMFCLDLLLSMSLYWDFSCQSWGWIWSCVELYYLALSLQIYSVYIEDVSTLVTSNQNWGSWGGGGGVNDELGCMRQWQYLGVHFAHLLSFFPCLFVLQLLCFEILCVHMVFCEICCSCISTFPRLHLCIQLMMTSVKPKYC